MGIFSSVKFQQANFKECILYHYDFTGDYSNIYQELDKIDDTLQQNKLNNDINYAKFGIFYDDPKITNKNSCRACLGIVSYGLYNKSNDDYLLMKGYYKKEFVSSESVMSKFVYINSFSIGLAVFKFYSKFYKLVEVFEKFKVKNDFKKFVVEIYKNDVIEFYVILQNEEEFLLHNSFKIKKII